MSKTHWKSLGDSSQYLGKQHFEENEEKTLTIKFLEEGVVENAQRRTKDKKRVLHFEEDVRPLILNVKNGNTIESVIGSPYWQDWVGKRITLFVDSTVPNNFDPDHPGAVRIRPYPPKVTEAVCEECGTVVAPVKADGKEYTVNKIVELSKAKYGKTLCWNCAKEHAKEEENG